MNKNLFLAFFCLVSSVAFAQKQNKSYQYSTDLTGLKDDKLFVELITPKVKTDEIEFQMPKMVPGTYAIYDFGRLLSDFKAFDQKGNPLTVARLDSNRWKIKNAKKLFKISYNVEDSFDSKLPNMMFEPAGTNFEPNENFVLNTFGVFGYLENMKEMPFDINIKRPANMYGATALVNKNANAGKENTDKFVTKNYFNLSDMPIMYAKPDTTNLMLGGAEIQVSVYSPDKKVTSKEIMNELKPIFLAQKDYLGGKLPVKKYAVIVYLTKKIGQSGSIGALEHSYSTVLYLLDGNLKGLSQTLKDVVAHEFFHIVTPLNIHSEEIGNYDFINAKMSKHLWMYEGCTEYAAQHVQVKHGLMPTNDFLKVIVDKMRGSDRHKSDISFTDMSLCCLDKCKDEYGNVYQKGALIGMLLDIKLRQLSKGTYGTQELMNDLAKKYGKDKSFKDEALFDEITKVSKFPEIRMFFKDYVEGTKALPYKEYLALVGMDYQEKTMSKQNLRGIGRGSVQPHGEGRMAITDETKLDDFGKSIGFKNGDIIIKWNGTDFVNAGIQEAMGAFMTAKENSDVTIAVLRTNERGEKSEVFLKGKVMTKEREIKHGVTLMTNATAEQLAMRKAWINK